jgi:hypothetical protein
MTTVEGIHDNLINGQRRQMVEQINEYGMYQFWEDFKEYLDMMYTKEKAYKIFSDGVISYHRIKGR